MSKAKLTLIVNSDLPGERPGWADWQPIEQAPYSEDQDLPPQYFEYWNGRQIGMGYRQRILLAGEHEFCDAAGHYIDPMPICFRNFIGLPSS